MQRKTSTASTRIYTYGIVEVLEGQDVLDEQFRLTRLFRNKLVEIELARLVRVRQTLNGRPTIAPLLAHEATLVRDLTAARDAIKAANAAKKLKQGPGPTEQMAVYARQIKQDLRSSRGTLKEIRQAVNYAAAVRRVGTLLNASPEDEKEWVKVHLELLNRGSVGTLIDALQAVPGSKEAVKIISDGREVIVEMASANVEAAQAIKAARADSKAYWGSRGLCENEMAAARKSGDDPQFRRDLTGRVGGQFIKTDGRNGITVQALYGDDSRIRLVPMADRVLPPGAQAPDSNSKRSLRRARLALWLRINSTDTGAPVWGKFRIVMHRPLPLDGVVKVAWVRRERIADRFRYEFQITVESHMFDAPAPIGKGTVAIDIGWRQMDEDSLRVAFLYDDRGNTKEIRLPEWLGPKGDKQSIQTMLDHADGIRATRDKEFDRVRALFRAWLEENDAPDWLRDALITMAHWRSCGRLAKVLVGWYVDGKPVPGWRDRRFAGDSDIYVVVEAWRKQDKHLWTWEAAERDKALARRKDFYRNVAHHEIATTYAKVLLEDFDLRKVIKRAAPEDAEKDSPQVQRHNRHQAALSEFRQIVEVACRTSGAVVEYREGAFTTIDCHKCGKRLVWDAAPKVEHTCANCGATWDQDHNAGINLHKAPRAAQ